jgi:hypothetical protein
MFELSLGDEHPIKGILVKGRKRQEMKGMPHSKG